ncbi:MAG TPA: DotU family type IV/VI secretion system protein [Polyangiaceae bacterium]|nr:DotU family type IV/VI secretion system protein [Polyangiaceae bacterium]
MNAHMYRACADSLRFALRIPTAMDLPAAPELRQRAVAALDGAVAQGRAVGLPEADLAEARYALVAFMDEQVLKSSWVGRAEWMSQPLQLIFYREYTAGENFFVRLRSILQSGSRPFALEIYYLCLVLGFRGAYGVSGEVSAVNGFLEAARRELAKSLPPTNKFAPNARARDHLGADRKSNAWLIALIIGCLGLMLLVLFGLHFELRSELGQILSSPNTTRATP